MTLRNTSVLFILLIPSLVLGQSVIKVPSRALYADPANVKVGGLLGESIAIAEKGRLTSLPDWNDGELIKIFGSEIKSTHNQMDWYGEHGGKWLYTATLAARQSHDQALEAKLIRTADYLVSTQEADGYLGVYSPAIRITAEKISHRRSWDTWNLSYMTMGLLQIYQYHPDEKYLGAAKKIGELFLKTFGDGSHDITEYGTRHGVSATIILEPVVALYKVTKDKRYLDFAELVIKKMNETEDARLVPVALNNGDMENVGDGKVYQILWNLTGLMKLYEVTGNPDYLKASKNAWQNVADYHLTISGGPWGGVGKHLECFNRKNYWSPYGFIETCSTMQWILLNKELLRVTGEARFAQEIEKAVYNQLLAAQYPDGQNWCYHTFVNGSLHEAHFNDCCPSSGAMALEELPSMIYSQMDNGIAINLFTESESTMKTGSGNAVRISQKTQYPFEGKIQVSVSPAKNESFPVFVRIPDWVTSAKVTVNGKPWDNQSLKSGEFFKVERAWREKDVLEIEFPMDLRVYQKTEEAPIPQGGGEIYRVNWLAMAKGPLVYSANGLIDGKDRERTFHLSSTNAADLFSPTTSPEGMKGSAYVLKSATQVPMVFVPYFEAGGRKTGSWRLTWIQNKID
jgi:DUF1680 family protein